MATRLNELKQAKHDSDAAIAKLRAEAYAMPAAGRTVAQAARLKALDAELVPLTQAAATIAVELAEAVRQQGEMIGESTLATTTGRVPRATGRKYAQMFPSLPIHSGGFASAEEFLATLHSGLADSRLVADYSAGRLGATHTVGDATSGGFSVPTQVFAEWLDASLESEIVRSRADVRPMLSNSAVAAGWDDLTHTDELYGGFSENWTPEAGDVTPDTAKMRLIELSAKKLALLARVSNELIADGVGFEEQLGQAIVKALGWFLDKNFLRGPGAGRPLGILNAGCTITVAKESGQSAGTISYENIVKMFARLTPISFDKAVWVCNQGCIPQLLQTSVAVGTGGNFVPLLVRSGTGGWEMLTRPVIFTEKVATLGTKGDVMLCDFSQYIVGIRGDFTLAKSQHLGFASDTSYYRGTIRIDGMPKISQPITPANGPTQSPFIALAARA